MSASDESFDPFSFANEENEMEHDLEAELIQHKRMKQKEEIKNLKVDEEHVCASWKFFKEVLGSPKYWCAPMVGASELAFRMMVRKYGAHIATTPMINAAGYVQSESYRDLYKFLPGPEDRPLVVQFWANNTPSFVEAAKLVEDKCDAVELNLGCPQQCAKSGHYGAYLMGEWELLYEIVSTASQAVQVPILCKVRIFKDYQKTLRYCEMLQNAGCSVITVHGRTREEKRSAVTLADWQVIAKLKRDLRIPVISNGNVRNFQDIEECFEITKCDGVMSACALLANPALFANLSEFHPFQLALEYAEYASKYQACALHVRKHIFSILRRPLNQNVYHREQLLLLPDENIDFGHVKDLIKDLERIELQKNENHAQNYENKTLEG